jgi:hypothetical protein
MIELGNSVRSRSERLRGTTEIEAGSRRPGCLASAGRASLATTSARAASADCEPCVYSLQSLVRWANETRVLQLRFVLDTQQP